MKHILKIPADIGKVIRNKDYHNVITITGSPPAEFVKGKNDIVKSDQFIFIIFSKLDKKTKIFNEQGNLCPKGLTAKELAQNYKLELLQGKPADLIPNYASLAPAKPAPVKPAPAKPAGATGHRPYVPPRSSPELKQILENQKIIIGLLRTVVNQQKPISQSGRPAPHGYRDPKSQSTRFFMNEVLSGQHQRRR